MRMDHRNNSTVIRNSAHIEGRARPPGPVNGNMVGATPLITPDERGIFEMVPIGLGQDFLIYLRSLLRDLIGTQIFGGHQLCIAAVQGRRLSDYSAHRSTLSSVRNLATICRRAM